MKKTIGIVGNIFFDFIMSLISGLIFNKIWGMNSFLIWYVIIFTMIFGISDLINYVLDNEALRFIR